MDKVKVITEKVVSIKAPFDVVFSNQYNGEITMFKVDTEESLLTIVSALSAFYSGDVYSCTINGTVVKLDRDYGIMVV